MSNGCVLGVTCNKPIRVSSPIPFKSQLRSRNGGFAIYMAELARAKTECFSSEDTDETIYGTSRIPPKPPEVKQAWAYTIIIFYIVILSFLISGMFVCCCASLCV